MYQNILLCTDGSPAADVAAEYAVCLAKQLGGRVTALYVTDVRILEGPLLADFSGALGAQPYSALLPQFEQIQREKADAILKAVSSRCAAQGVKSEVIRETGGLVGTMLDHETDADLVVLGQRGEHARWSEGMLGSSVERMVRASVKPCLVTSDRFRPIKHILLAHDGSAESTKALRAGIELAVDLGAELTVVTVCQRDNEETASKILQQAHRQAVEKKLAAHAQLEHGNAEAEILKLCERIGADLIVMGAYGHTRIRELILGSTTSHVLRKAQVPVLLTRNLGRS
jgi:nucleotide-binding universal stress UspA family protein